MQRAIGFVLIAALLAVVSAYDCNANLSGGNNASPARWTRSSSCDANLSGDNNASPARFFGSRTAPVCSGKGGCVNGACVCNPGFQGENCEYDCTSTVAPSTAAPTVQLTLRPTTVAPTTTCPPCPCGEANLSGDNNASPARRMRRNGDACPTCKACPTTAAPTTTTAAPTTTTAAPTTTAPPVQLTPRPTTVAPTTTCAPCPCGSEANLSGDNNASPARRARTACPVCKACPTVAPSTAAPTTTTAAPTTTAPPVQLTPRPTTVAPTTTCPPCPCGSEVNLSGDNNASPARNVRTTCPVCKACPTAAPTTTSPPVQATSPATPTTLAPCWTCPSGFIHWYDAGITVAPGNDRCACVPVATTSSPATSSAPQTSEAPSVGLPICGTPEANLSGDNNASPARNIRSSSCNVNLSGGNNASPARRFRNVYTEAVCNGKGGCVNGGCVCNVGYRGENCEEQYCIVASSTSAPTVNLTPKPATSRAPTQNESGEDNSRESSSATKVTAFFGLIVAIIVSLIL